MIHSNKAEADGWNRKKKRRICRAIVIVAAVIVIGIAWFGIVQRNNIRALYLAATSDTETLKQNQEERDKKREELLQQYGLTRPDISHAGEGDGEKNQGASEQEEELPVEDDAEAPQNPSSGSASEPNEQLPVEDNAEAPQDPSSGSASAPASDPNPDDSQLQLQLQEYINQLYQVEARYMEFLDEMVEATKREFWSLPHDQQNSENKMKLVSSKLDELIAQENACDAEVESILSGIQDILEEQGNSTALVDEIRAYYEDSKATWKASKMTELYS